MSEADVGFWASAVISQNYFAHDKLVAGWLWIGSMIVWLVLGKVYG